MSDKPIALVPGLLITVSTRVEGGCEYKRKDISHEKMESADVAKWEMTRVILDKVEWDRAGKVRGRCRKLITGQPCITTPFGFLICPLDHEAELDAKIAEAQGLAAAFNADAHHSQIRIVTMRGSIAETSGEAEAAVQQELVSLMQRLDAVIKTGDVVGIRDVCKETVQVAKLLEAKSSGKDKALKAVGSGRSLARRLKLAAEAGEQHADVIAAANLKPISAARLFFAGLDEGDDEEEQGEQEQPNATGSRFADAAGDDAGEQEETT